jgi:ABC-type transporter MlaC component
MNKTILAITIAMIICISFAQLSSSAQVNKKSEEVRKYLKEASNDVKESKADLNDAKLNLKKANKNSTDDYIAFKQEAERDFANNKKTITQLKAKKWNSTEKSKKNTILKLNHLKT